jgi:uncharacterized membrane protein
VSREPTKPAPSSGAVPESIQRNLEHLSQIEAESLERAGRHQHRVERVTRALAKPAALYVFVALAAAWVAVNTAQHAAGASAWDPPPFALLQGAIGLYAAVVVSAVLVAQRRENELTEHRAKIDLQVNLLAEQKIAKLIALVEELRRDLPMVEDREDPEAADLAEHVDAATVHAALAPQPIAAGGTSGNDRSEDRGGSPR